MGGGRDLCVVELGEQLGEDSIHYSGFGVLGDMLRDQTKFQEQEEEEMVLDNRLQNRSQQPTLIEARLPGYKLKGQQKDGNLTDISGLQDYLAVEERLQGLESPGGEMLQVTKETGVQEKSEGDGMKIEMEACADSLDLLPLEVEVRTHR